MTKPNQIVIQCEGNGPTKLHLVEGEEEFTVSIYHDDGEGLEVAVSDVDIIRLVRFLESVCSKTC